MKKDTRVTETPAIAQPREKICTGRKLASVLASAKLTPSEAAEMGARSQKWTQKLDTAFQQMKEPCGAGALARVFKSGRAAIYGRVHAPK